MNRCDAWTWNKETFECKLFADIPGVVNSGKRGKKNIILEQDLTVQSSLGDDSSDVSSLVEGGEAQGTSGSGSGALNMEGVEIEGFSGIVKDENFISGVNPDAVGGRGISSTSSSSTSSASASSSSASSFLEGGERKSAFLSEAVQTVDAEMLVSDDVGDGGNSDNGGNADSGENDNGPVPGNTFGIAPGPEEPYGPIDPTTGERMWVVDAEKERSEKPDGELGNPATWD